MYTIEPSVNSNSYNERWSDLEGANGYPERLRWSELGFGQSLVFGTCGAGRAARDPVLAIAAVPDTYWLLPERSIFHGSNYSGR